jgi:putative DNA primase/helicase
MQISTVAYSEDAIALKFMTLHVDDLRFVSAWSQWFRWNGARWEADATLMTLDLVREVVRTVALDLAQHSNGKDHIKLASNRVIAAVEHLARSDQNLAAPVAIWDRDNFLLGGPYGTVDLQTGALHPAAAADHITKSTLCSPAETADCPLWLKFLHEATRGDAAFIRFLQQWCGYCLTGDIREHALLFLFGPGGNGKGVFLDTIKAIMGDYAVVAAMDVFTASKTDRHSTELAMLRGARMVCVSETEEGRSWAEQRIKMVTGGDEVTARFLYQDNFTFLPQFKPTIIGNNQPVLRNVDEAVRRRFNFGPFKYTPPAPDRTLKFRLVPEYPAILRWMIDGCLDWQANGLVRPPVVRAATAAYFADQDSVQQWLDDCCNVAPDLVDTNQSLFASWRAYAERHNEPAGSSKGLAHRLDKLGFRAIKDQEGIRGRGFKGLKVKVYEPESSGDQYA